MSLVNRALSQGLPQKTLAKHPPDCCGLRNSRTKVDREYISVLRPKALGVEMPQAAALSLASAPSSPNSPQNCGPLGHPPPPVPGQSGRQDLPFTHTHTQTQPAFLNSCHNSIGLGPKKECGMCFPGPLGSG